MGIFGKKPVVFDASCFETKNGADDKNMTEIIDWLNGGNDFMASHDKANLFIKTLDGKRRADVYDWIIKEMRGEFYPYKRDIFATDL
jgi:hypothetical protein